MKRTWTAKDEQILSENIGKLPISDIAILVRRTERAVRLHLIQHKKTAKPFLADNLNPLVILLKKRFVNARWFKPDKEFYAITGINQKRWNRLIRGEAKITDLEFLNVIRCLNICHEEQFEYRHLSLFDEL